MKVGLTGNIGSGKSLALELFAEAGAAVIDCDDVVAEMYAKPHVFHAALQALLGDDVIGDHRWFEPEE